MCHKITIVGVMSSPSRWPYRQLSDQRRYKQEDLHADDPKFPWNDKNFGCTSQNCWQPGSQKLNAGQVGTSKAPEWDCFKKLRANQCNFHIKEHFD